MDMRTLGISLLATTLVLGACQGRTAAWEEKSTKSPDTTNGGGTPAATGDLAGAMEVWKGRDTKEGALAAIAAFEKLAGCKDGTSSPAERCTNVSTDASQSELLAMVTRANYYYADSFMRGDENGFLDYTDRAVWWGERALLASSPEFAAKMREKAKFEEAIVTIQAPAIPAAYWYATALGKWARAKGFGVLVGQKDRIKATMTRLVELDPNFYHGGPHRYFGAFYAVAPDFAGGDLGKSREHYDKALEIAPYFLGTKVLMAENLATKLDDEELFDKLLAEVIAADLSTVPPEILPEMKAEQEKARELQKKKTEEDLF